MGKEDEIEDTLKKEIKEIRENDSMMDLQEDLFEYFKSVGDRLFIEFVDCFVYNTGTQNTKVSKLTTKFLKDNGLVYAHLNYIYDRKHPKQFFGKSSLSERSMIAEIQTSLLSLSHNRFRNSLSNPKPLVTLTKVEKRDITSIITSCQRDNLNLMEDEANELIAERKRFTELFPKVLTILNK